MPSVIFSRIDSAQLLEKVLTREVMGGGSYDRVWTDGGGLTAQGDSLLRFISESELYGLIPGHYHGGRLSPLMVPDSVKRAPMPLEESEELEVWMTDAFIRLGRHLLMGRLQVDTANGAGRDVSIDRISVQRMFDGLSNRQSLRGVLELLEPSHAGYRSLKAAMPAFLRKLDRRRYTYVQFPYKDSLRFVRQLQVRLSESGYLKKGGGMPDAETLQKAVRKFQADARLKVDGNPGRQVVGALNRTGYETFIRVAINMDRYKLLPDRLPERYVWVNIAEYMLRYYEMDTVRMSSRVIVGAPDSRTPEYASSISRLVTHPDWNVPSGIASQEMIPKILNDTSYLSRSNMVVVDRQGRPVDVATVDWAKAGSGSFPYYIRQKSGRGNALGSMKFHFNNPYAVYLHDTNARGLFSRTSRSMSHGCVRVEQWKKLAVNLLQIDSGNMPVDSLYAVLNRGQQRHLILKTPVPIFLKYFTAIAHSGSIVFLEDPYGSDMQLRERIVNGGLPVRKS